MIDNIYKIIKVGENGPPVRFAVQIDDIQYRIFSYFPVGKDSSISVQFYNLANHVYEKTIDTPPAELSEEEKSFSLSEAKKLAIPFTPHKHTFHKSGILNAKDRNGERLNDNPDIRSICFDQIKDSIRLCYFFPMYYINYPKIKSNNKKHHNVFELKGAVARMPSIIEVRLCKKNFNFINKLKEAYPGFAAFVDDSTLETKDLDIYTVFRKSNDSYFPTAHAFAKEWY